MRGLKPKEENISGENLLVASFTDAWIETSVKKIPFCETMSHLLQMRGLKHFWRNIKMAAYCRIFYRCVDWNLYGHQQDNRAQGSHLLQMRGLKPPTVRIRSITYPSHLLQMRGLKRQHCWVCYLPCQSHLLQMRGLKHVLLLFN